MCLKVQAMVYLLFLRILKFLTLDKAHMFSKLSLSLCLHWANYSIFVRIITQAHNNMEQNLTLERYFSQDGLI